MKYVVEETTPSNLSNLTRYRQLNQLFYTLCQLTH